MCVLADEAGASFFDILGKKWKIDSDRDESGDSRLGRETPNNRNDGYPSKLVGMASAGRQARPETVPGTRRESQVISSSLK